MQEKSKKYSEISERISQVIDFLGVNPNKFVKVLGYNRTQTIYDILNQKSAPSFEFFNRFYNSEYSELVDPIWLLTGKGSIGTTIRKIGVEPEQNSCCLCQQRERTIAALEKALTICEKNNASLEQLIAEYRKGHSRQTGT